MTFTLAVCSEMVYLDEPHLDRVKRIHDAGFAVEIWDWTAKDAAALAATGARFTSMTGYVSGDLTSPDGTTALLASAADSIAVRPPDRCTRTEPARDRSRGGWPPRPASGGRDGGDVAGRAADARAGRGAR